MASKPSYRIRIKPNKIILLHSFNSAPANKADEIKAFLKENSLEDVFELIAPQLSYINQHAIREINQLIRQHKTGNVYIIGSSLGGFYANYFRAKYHSDENVIVYAINPSWTPSLLLQQNLNQELQNLKTNEKWNFRKEYLIQLEEFETFVTTNLKYYKGKNYNIHLSNSDKVIEFDNMLNYLNEHKIPHQLHYYNTDHVFKEIRKVMEQLVKARED
jgi:predicted esterase YcpF (UPF0227 family)